MDTSKAIHTGIPRLILQCNVGYKFFFFLNSEPNSILGYIQTASIEVNGSFPCVTEGIVLTPYGAI